MDLQKITDIIPTINTYWLKEKCAYFKVQTLNFFNNVDIVAFVKGLAVVISVYALIFIYIYVNSASTIEQIKEQITVENIPLTLTKKPPNKRNINDENHTPISVIKGLHEITDIGRLPIIRTKDNFTSFRAYQKPFSFKELSLNKPIISFVLVDYGLSKENSLSALDLLPAEVSFVLSPYASLPAEWMSMAQDKGHEVWINLPIQNSKSYDFGKYSVYHHSPLSDKMHVMYKTLSKTQGYVGAGTYTDEYLNSAKQHYLKLAEDIYHRGLGILELNPDAPTSIEGKALSMGAPYIKADLEIFKIKGKKNSFEKLEDIAQENGHAVAVIPNYPSTIKNAAVWIMKVAKADYIIAPVSTIYDLPLYRHNGNSGNSKEIVATPLHKNDHIEPEEAKHLPTSHH